MLLEIPAKSQKNAKIMPDFFKKCHLNSKNAFVLFQTKRTNSYIICPYQQQVILNNSLFIKLGVRIKTFPANSHYTVIFKAQLPCAGYTQPRLAQFNLPEVDCSDRSLAIDDGTGLSSVSCKSVADAILAEKEKELPAGHLCLFFVYFSTSCNGNRQSTHTSNTTQVHN